MAIGHKQHSNLRYQLGWLWLELVISFGVFLALLLAGGFALWKVLQ